MFMKCKHVRNDLYCMSDVKYPQGTIWNWQIFKPNIFPVSARLFSSNHYFGDTYSIKEAFFLSNSCFLFAQAAYNL